MDQGIEKWRHHAIFSDLQYVYVICILFLLCVLLVIIIISSIIIIICAQKRKIIIWTWSTKWVEITDVWDL